MSTEVAIEDAVRAILLDVLELGDLSIGSTDSIRDLPGIDSMKVLRVIATIERRYDVELDDDVVFRIETLAQLVASIKEAQQDSAAALAGE